MSPLAPSAASAFLSASANLAARASVSSLESGFDDFKNTFSSWDSCMSKAYCKWPVIAAIILASLILLSLLTSLVRCLCCGLECCFGCFACCNACCPAPRGGTRTKYVQAPQQAWPQGPPPPPQPYSWQPDMAYGAPATATFDAPSNNRRFKGVAARAAMVGNADALPAMPSWQNAQSRRVQQAEEDANEETALQEEGRHGIALGVVGGGSGRPQVRFASGSALAQEADEQSALMHGTIAPTPPHPQPRIDTNYNYSNTNAPTAYSPRDTPYPTTHYIDLDPRTYNPQPAYNDYTNSFGAVAATAPYSPVHDVAPRDTYAQHAISSPTSYYEPTPVNPTVPAAHGAFNYGYNHGVAAAARTGGLLPQDASRSPTASVPPAYRERSWSTEPSFHVQVPPPPQQQQQQQQQRQLGYPGYGGGEDEVEGYGGYANGNGGGSAGGSGSGSGNWAETRSRSEIARKPVGALRWREV